MTMCPRKLDPVLATFIASTILSVVAMGACSAMTSPHAAEASFAAEQLDCVDHSATLAESNACRQAVRAKWHVVKDGGAQ